MLTSVVAAYALATVWSLRGTEDTWRAALAVDEARVEADAEIAATFRNLDAPDDPAADHATDVVGRSAASALGRFERDLRARRIVDREVAATRDAMADALQFRQRQLGPARGSLGDTPLRKADAALTASLRRWHLRPKPPASPAELARLDLSHMADWRTGTVLIAAGDGELYVIDVDHDETHVLDVGLPADAIVVPQPQYPGVVVLAGGTAKAYSVGSGGVAWERPATAIAAGVAANVWVANGSSVVAVDGSGRTVAPPVTLPRGRRLVGATGERLVLAGAGTVEVWDPKTPGTAPSILGLGSFVAAAPAQVAFQLAASTSLRITQVPSGAERTIDLPPTDAGAAAFSSDGDLAFAAGPPAGRVAAMLVYHSVTSSLRGLDGPSAAIAGGVAWSGDGRDVFWLTAEGRIAVRTVGREPQILRTPYAGLTRLAAIDASGR